MRVLVLGGTSEASALARLLAGCADIQAILSLAGRTERPAPAPIPVRSGGFGGVEGLAAYLRGEGIEAVIDATHPFAAQMSHHAAEACPVAGVPRLTLGRAPWARREGDRWIEVDDMDAAAAALGRPTRRVLLTVGRLSLCAFARAPQHTYVVRTIDPREAIDALPSHRLISARGPFSVDAERALMCDERIEVLVSKNSGGEATYAKIEAARELGLPVVMVRRPAGAGGDAVESVEAVMEWLKAIAKC